MIKYYVRHSNIINDSSYQDYNFPLLGVDVLKLIDCIQPNSTSKVQ